MPEINFYHSDENVAKPIAALLLKALEDKKNTLIFCESEAQLKEIDASLWSYGRSSFIPHVTDSDVDFDFKRQPILLTTKEENLNEASYLIFLTEPSEKFISGFKRVFYFFEDGGKAASARVKADKVFKKVDGVWKRA